MLNIKGTVSYEASRERAALEKQRLEIARIALAEKVPVDMIQRLTGLTLEQIQTLTLH
ncbi:hypothetical protein AGMMS50225_15450 [Betaproteobacteria bacterium]|nr:hypothetical protein AGMMS50225_15450 [Betaproteobacteria bacterium]